MLLLESSPSQPGLGQFAGCMTWLCGLNGKLFVTETRGVYAMVELFHHAAKAISPGYLLPIHQYQPWKWGSKAVLWISQHCVQNLGFQSAQEQQLGVLTEYPPPFPYFWGWCTWSSRRAVCHCGVDRLSVSDWVYTASSTRRPSSCLEPLDAPGIEIIIFVMITAHQNC